MRRLLTLVLPVALACAFAAASVPAQTAPPGPAHAPTAADVIKADPVEILRAARIVYVSSGTSFFEAVQLQNELRKRADFTAWGMAIVDDWEGRKLADIEIEIDRPLFTYTFTYKVTDRRTGIVLATGKVTGWDGNDAAPKLAKRIAEEIKRAHQPAAEKKNAAKEGKRDARAAAGAQVKN